MPTNRFGEVNTTPLYNATGRINRGEAPQVAPFSPANAGTQRDWSAMKRPKQAQSPFPEAFENISQMNRRYGNNPTTGGGSGGGGGGAGGFSADDITKIVGALPPVTATFAPQDTSKNYGQGAVDRPRVTDNWQQPQGGQGTTFAPQDTSKNYGDMGGGEQPEKAPRAPRAPRTEDQKKATAEKRAQKKAENPAYGTRNPSRTKAVPKPKAVSKPQPAAKPSKTGAVVNDASSNNAFQGNDNTFGGGGDGSPAPGFMNAGKIEGMAISTAGNATQRK
jgi:hypothetical protein